MTAMRLPAGSKSGSQSRRVKRHSTKFVVPGQLRRPCDEHRLVDRDDHPTLERLASGGRNSQVSVSSSKHELDHFAARSLHDVGDSGGPQPGQCGLAQRYSRRRR